MTVTYTSDRAIADIPGATYDALQARFRALAAVIDLASAERAALWREISRREKDASIEARLSALSEDGRAAARAVLG